MTKKSFFQCVKHQFPDAEKSKIKTHLFLEAAVEIVELIVQLGKAFAPVKYDMSNNIEKIKSVYEKNKLQNEYLQDLILHEKQQNANLAISGLQWLRRGLHFILKFFESIIESYKNNTITDNLEKLLHSAYTETLMPYHRWLTQQLFNILCRMSLTRAQFFKILAKNQDISDDIIISDMENYIVNLRKCVTDLTFFYINNQLENTGRV